MAKLVFTVEVSVDPEEWATEYSLQGPAVAVDDAKTHLREVLYQSLVGMMGWGTVKSVAVNPLTMATFTREELYHGVGFSSEARFVQVS